MICLKSFLTRGLYFQNLLLWRVFIFLILLLFEVRGVSRLVMFLSSSVVIMLYATVTFFSETSWYKLKYFLEASKLFWIFSWVQVYCNWFCFGFYESLLYLIGGFVIRSPIVREQCTIHLYLSTDLLIFVFVSDVL